MLLLVISINYLNSGCEIVAGVQIIMDVAKFFNSSSKIRNLSDQTYPGEEPKKADVWRVEKY